MSESGEEKSHVGYLYGWSSRAVSFTSICFTNEYSLFGPWGNHTRDHVVSESFAILMRLYNSANVGAGGNYLENLDKS